jgi:glyoxylase-like metal-dependent hydrolase (beta-lactamase superfamily II)
MELIRLTASSYYFKSAVNIGYIRTEDKGMLIDAGIDSNTSKKVAKLLKEKELPLTHLFITHAHADHYGGAAFLIDTHHVTTISPPLEEVILKDPAIHTMMMNLGNNSVDELRNKFLQGKAINVDIICGEGANNVDGITFETLHFPGHSHFQMAILFDNILFAADAYFGVEALTKHKIPFIVDAEQTITSLEKLLHVNCHGAIPGHGTFEKAFQETVHANIKQHQDIYKSIVTLLERDMLTLDDLVSEACHKWDITLNNYMAYLLYRTSINAYVIKGMNTGEITYKFEDNKMLYHKNR